MISPAGNATGLLQRLAQNATTLKAQLDTELQRQSTGLVAQDYAGLGTDARTSLDLRPAMQHQQVWQHNVDALSSRLTITQSTLTQITSIASTFYAQVNNLNGLSDSVAANIGVSAKAALTQVAQLLNTKAGDVYVFAGQDTANPPLPSTDPAVLGPALLASDVPTDPPFSATIGTATPEVEIGDGQRLPAGLLANQNTLAISAAPTTGSYMRDIMRALATLATVTDAPSGQAVAADTRTRLASAIGAIGSESGALGNLQAEMQTRQAALATTQTALDKQVSNVEDVDMAATLTNISALQTQLQASYQIIAGVKNLTLSSYLVG